MAKSDQPIRVTLLAGGVGGAKLAEGLANISRSIELSIIANTADDQEFHGLWVSPDVDTLTYTLADMIDRNQGWGLNNDTTHTLEALTRLGDDTWMQLGDMDFATHIYRTNLRRQGVRPTEIAARIAESLGVSCRIILPTDNVIQTRVQTNQGWMDFQSYFVRNRCLPEVLDIAITGIEQARPTPEALAAIQQADLIILAPSNPVVSIGPILSVPGIRQAIANSSAAKFAVSPLIGGKTVKGPADKMLKARGVECTPAGIASCYQGLIDGIVIDDLDATPENLSKIDHLNVLTTATLMKTFDQKISVANQILDRYLEVEKSNLVKPAVSSVAD